MTEADVEPMIQRARERYPDARSRIISDNGPQFVARDLEEFIRFCGMTHLGASPDYPQSNGKIERCHRSLKAECIRPGTPLALEDARRLVEGFVRDYNEVRSHSAIGYVTPEAKLAGSEPMSFGERARKLERPGGGGELGTRPLGRSSEALGRGTGWGRPWVSSRRTDSCLGDRQAMRYPLS
jgi:hypothetical protein